ncbi:MAG: UvrD-helicase domain-containing protein, partial [Eubacterium sp.]|nr:UvrD-helicase domain-containing protein [Eubacterium sp.]
MQQQAVDCTEGPLLILAGAGSGKTTVLVNRVQHIIGDGLALPWQVL